MSEGKVKVLVLIKRTDKVVKKEKLHWVLVGEDGFKSSDLPPNFKVLLW